MPDSSLLKEGTDQLASQPASILKQYGLALPVARRFPV